MTLLMIIFGLLTIANVHQCQHRIKTLTVHTIKFTMNKSSGPANGNTAKKQKQKQKQKTGHSLLQMLLFQVLLLITTVTLPLSIQKFHASFSATNKSPSDLAIEAFSYNRTVLIYFISNGMPFYI
ncbi:unnamed protein product [Rotaria socialis]|uniref:Uncharacterized protein n=1 Tax=Rotaria socialis TaxID=392032 RepID=A0A818BFT4_9BILA|nr:unnamed protein product [Rotaria socialis]